MESGKLTGKVSDRYFGVFVCSIVLFIFGFISMCLMCSLNTYLVAIFAGLEFFGYAALIVLYSRLQNTINVVDIYMYEYLRNNKCTDGALARGID